MYSDQLKLDKEIQKSMGNSSSSSSSSSPTSGSNQGTKWVNFKKGLLPNGTAHHMYNDKMMYNDSTHSILYYINKVSINFKNQYGDC